MWDGCTTDNKTSFSTVIFLKFRWGPTAKGEVTIMTSIIAKDLQAVHRCFGHHSIKRPLSHKGNPELLQHKLLGQVPKSSLILVEGTNFTQLPRASSTVVMTFWVGARQSSHLTASKSAQALSPRIGNNNVSSYECRTSTTMATQRSYRGLAEINRQQDWRCESCERTAVSSALCSCLLYLVA